MAKKYCLLIIYRNKKGGECSSKLTSIYCCKRLIRALNFKKLRHSLGGISTVINKHNYDKWLRYYTLEKHYLDDKWLRYCPFCKSKISMRKILIDEIPYKFIVKQEILNAATKITVIGEPN